MGAVGSLRRSKGASDAKSFDRDSTFDPMANPNNEPSSPAITHSHYEEWQLAIRRGPKGILVFEL